jgi:hypothetical protein
MSGFCLCARRRLHEETFRLESTRFCLLLSRLLYIDLLLYIIIIIIIIIIIKPEL